MSDNVGGGVAGTTLAVDLSFSSMGVFGSMGAGVNPAPVGTPFLGTTHGTYSFGGLGVVVNPFDFFDYIIDK
jgi:hypothetical protein